MSMSMDVISVPCSLTAQCRCKFQIHECDRTPVIHHSITWVLNQWSKFEGPASQNSHH